jgi:hypothetical protein
MQSLAPSSFVARSWARGAFASVLVLAGLVACGSSSPPPRSTFPQCTASQQCVGNSPADWVCRERCEADGGGCPTGTTCQTMGGCCTGSSCLAINARVCVPDTGGSDAGPDASSDASSDSGSDSSSDSSSDAPSDTDADAARDATGGDADGGFPQCTTGQACVGYPSFGDWVCLSLCTGADGGDCPTGFTCVHEGGCCVGVACSAISVAVCVMN